VSGLSDDRQAMYMKIHHAAIDGVSGTELMGLLLDLSPEGRDLAPTEPFRPEPAPGTATLIGWAARSLAMRPVSVLRIGAEAARTAPLLGDVVSPLLNRGRGHGDGDVIATRLGRPREHRSIGPSPRTATRFAASISNRSNRSKTRTASRLTTSSWRCPRVRCGDG
jgi:diacylglycerol O-acyltransferase / wax synthase